MELIARGRASDVFDLGAGRVLRRYRTNLDVAREARTMQHLRVHGYPVPQVFHAHGTDMVIERIHGRTLFDELLDHPDQFRRYGRLLGELHERLHRLPAPAWLTEGAEGASVGTERTVIIHRDLHPRNVIVSECGPVVIDWTEASAGRASVDTAITAIVTLGADLDVESSVAEQIEPFRALFINAFLQACGADARDGLQQAIDYRLGNPNNTPNEMHWLEQIAPGCLDVFYREQRESS
ncbi:phosphotransferase [Rathayibacter soli]|uniref:phosphotransferase n=1 Tax=Rathayibacter soli TaxID=3144168 RepID=UPI0027E3B766|nr:phosphotransferase [Glaciibacter superstes]